VRAADKGAAARKLVDWRNALAPKWAAIRFGAMTVETNGEQHFIVGEVFLQDASPDMVRVELYADGAKGEDAVRQEMTRLRHCRVKRAATSTAPPFLPPAGDGLHGANRAALRRRGLAVPRSKEGKTMKKTAATTCLFLDIGGVLLTDGWDHRARRRAAKYFRLDWVEMENRHHLTSDTYEEGKLTLKEYLEPGGLPPKADVHPDSVLALHGRAIEILPRDDRAGRPAQGPARAEDRRGQQRGAGTERVSDSQVRAQPAGGCLCVLLLRPSPTLQSARPGGMWNPSLRWPTWMGRRTHLRPRASEPPLRAELFSGEQLRRHAVALAGQHRIDPKPGSNRLLLRLADNEQVLIQAYDLVTRAEAEGRRVAPAGEWLLDNFYLIEQQIRLTRLHLPRTYSRELPRLLNGAAAGFPRVYDIALELIAHVDGRVDAENVSHFVTAYQSVTPLTLGELWAVPIMLRLGLIENLRRVSVHIARRRRDRNLANLWAGRLLAAVEKEPATVLHVLAEMAESDPPFSNQFVEEFCGRLQGQGPALATVQSWVQHRLAEQGLTREQLQRADNQTQAADQVSIGNSIGSLRFLSAMDWRKFVETMSIVEQVLRTDPAGVYAAMDFVTRDRYRHCVEALSRQSGSRRGHGGPRRDSTRDGSIPARRPAGAHRPRGILSHRQRPTAAGERRPRPLVPPSVLHAAGPPVPGFLLCRFPVGDHGGTASLMLEPVSRLGWHDWRVWLLLVLGIIGASQMAVALVNLLTNFWSARACCRAWISRKGSRPPTAPWWSSPRS
jgi:hypothetical protein